LPSRANLAQDVAIFEIAFGEFEHGLPFAIALEMLS
jgi:hypothetical protein